MTFIISCLPASECQLQTTRLAICTQQQNRLNDALLEPGPQVSEQQPHRRKEPLGADLGHRQCSECKGS